jgi:hypothetical protein
MVYVKRTTYTLDCPSVFDVGQASLDARDAFKIIEAVENLMLAVSADFWEGGLFGPGVPGPYERWCPQMFNLRRAGMPGP